MTNPAYDQISLLVKRKALLKFNIINCCYYKTVNKKCNFSMIISLDFYNKTCIYYIMKNSLSCILYSFILFNQG